MAKQNPKNENKSFEDSVIAELNYLLTEGFLCLTEKPQPTIALNPEVNT
jgi:hypothetical protein